MLKNGEFWTLTVVGAAAVALAVANAVLFIGNRSLQQEAGQRAQFIQQSIALEGLYREMLQGLADRAMRTRDEQVRDLLAADGIKLDFAARAPEAQP